MYTLQWTLKAEQRSSDLVSWDADECLVDDISTSCISYLSIWTFEG